MASYNGVTVLIMSVAVVLAYAALFTRQYRSISQARRHLLVRLKENFAIPRLRRSIGADSAADVTRSVKWSRGTDRTSIRRLSCSLELQASGYNQDGKRVISFNRTVVVYKKDHAPKMPRSAG
jgi:hypothetical protein